MKGRDTQHTLADTTYSVEDSSFLSVDSLDGHAPSNGNAATRLLYDPRLHYSTAFTLQKPEDGVITIADVTVYAPFPP